MLNYQKTILSQYANSPTITEILQNINENIDTTLDAQEFYDNYFNIDTAVGEGLDIWGAIVGVGRRLKLTLTDTVVAFIVEDWSPGEMFNRVPLSQAPAWSGAVLGTWMLDDSTYRQVILAKAAANISDGTIPALNRFLQSYFGDRGQAYAQDNYDMSITYVCNFRLTDFDRSILTNNNIAPTVCGVKINIESQ